MAIAVSDLGTVEDTGTDAQASFSFGSFGAEASDRYLIALITARDSFSNDFTATAVTIGGVSASRLQTVNPDTTTQSVLAIAAVPSGTSGTVVVDWSEAVASDQLCTLLRVTGISSATPYDTDAQISDGNNTTLTATIDCEAGGLVVAVAAVSGTRSFTPSLANEAADQAASDIGHSQSASWEVFGSAQTGLTVSATPNAIASDKTIVVAAFSPVTSIAYTLDCEAGSFALAGQTATLSWGARIAADRGQFTFTGNDATLTNGYGIVAEAGAFTLTGRDAALTSALSFAADQGSFALTGNAAGLSAGYVVAADVGAFTLTGNAAGLTFGGSLTAEAGAFTLAGNDAGLSVGYQVTAEAGSFTLTGLDASLAFAATLAAEGGSFTLTGYDAFPVASLVLDAEAGAYTRAGFGVEFRFSGWAQVPAGGTWTVQQDAATWVVKPSAGGWTTKDNASGGWVVQQGTATWRTV